VVTGTPDVVYVDGVACTVTGVDITTGELELDYGRCGYIDLDDYY
jgi:hypothetical protein